MVKFRTGNFFMLRNNLFPINYHFSEKDSLNIFKEAILIASSELYSTMQKDKRDLSKKKQTHLEISSNKYKKRITERPTPFGLFSSISVGEIGEKNNLSLSRGKNKFVKGATPTFDWILSIIKIIEKDLALLGHKTIIQLNDSVYHLGHVFILDESSNYGKTPKVKENRRFLLKETHLLKYVAQFSKNPITIEKLLTHLKENSRYTETQLRNYLQQLIDNEFIISNFRPQFFDTDSLERIITPQLSS